MVVIEHPLGRWRRRKAWWGEALRRRVAPGSGAVRAPTGSGRRPDDVGQVALPQEPDGQRAAKTGAGVWRRRPAPREAEGLARQWSPTARSVTLWSAPLQPVFVPHPVDIHVGGRLRLARTARGRSQQEVGEAVEVSAQQIQKYESGANRMSASTLFRLCGFLGRPVAWFFEGLEPTAPASGAPDPFMALMASREGAQLALSMARLSPDMRRKVLAVIKAFLPEEPSAET